MGAIVILPITGCILMAIAWATLLFVDEDKEWRPAVIFLSMILSMLCIVMFFDKQKFNVKKYKVEQTINVQTKNGVEVKRDTLIKIVPKK